MKNWHDKTIDVYDNSAQELADYFKGIGPRISDIERALQLADTPTNARVIEIGCGDGRDAAEIIKRVGWYEGVDPSGGLLKIARRELPNASFVQDDALSYEYPENLDVIFAFASLLHVDQHDLQKVLAKFARALRAGGIAYLSLKERKAYTEEIKKDQHGERMFYFYNVPLVQKLAGDAFISVHQAHQTNGSTDWFTIGLQKR